MNFRESATGTLLSEGLERGRAALSSSTTVQWLRRLASKTATVADGNRAAGGVQWTTRVVRTSWLYQWFTAEPEPDVVVIDLRETMTVGPLLLLLERVAGPVARNWRKSRAETVATRLSEQFTARPVSVVSTVALVAILVNLFFLVGLGSPSSSAVGMLLVAASLALAGTRVTLSADELTESGVYALAVALLSPPEPPDERDDSSPE